MPYIVTTKRPGREEFRLTASGREKLAELGHDVTEDALARVGWESVSRRAVATLEEAREVCIEACPEEMQPALLVNLSNQIAGIRENGGTVALPTGTVIAVKRISWAEVRALGGLSPEERFTETDVLDAYNARAAA